MGLFVQRIQLEAPRLVRTRANERWFILKPGFADRAQGIRLFSSQEELYVEIEVEIEAPLMKGKKYSRRSSLIQTTKASDPQTKSRPLGSSRKKPIKL